MTLKGLVFKRYAEEIIWKYGFGSDEGISLSPDTLLHKDDDRLFALRDELVREGWMREYTVSSRSRHGWVCHRGVDSWAYYAITEKGWEIASRYVGFSSKEEVEEQLHLAMIIAEELGEDVDAEQYREDYIARRKPGWCFLG